MKTVPLLLTVGRPALIGLASLCLGSLGLAPGHLPSGAQAATTMPPLLDINARCEAAHRKNVDAMSECVVAESEARATILRTWDEVPEAKASACLKASRKNERSPYVTLAKCLGDEASNQAPAAKK